MNQILLMLVLFSISIVNFNTKLWYKYYSMRNKQYNYITYTLDINLRLLCVIMYKSLRDEREMIKIIVIINKEKNDTWKPLC